MAERQEIPLFPLGNVLFTGGRLPLQIFEPRYLDLVGRCMKDDTGFGVVLIREGRETFQGHGPPALFDIGTYAKIIDFNPVGQRPLGNRVHRGHEVPRSPVLGSARSLGDGGG